MHYFEIYHFKPTQTLDKLIKKETNNSDLGANICDLGLQSKILLKHITNHYKNKQFGDLARLYDSLDINQNFVSEVLQEMEVLFTSSKSKSTKKSFDRVKPQSKRAFTSLWKAHVKGKMDDDGFDSIKKQKKNKKKKQKVGEVKI